MLYYYFVPRLHNEINKEKENSSETEQKESRKVLIRYIIYAKSLGNNYKKWSSLLLAALKKLFKVLEN
jgi:hypothetical protein